MCARSGSRVIRMVWETGAVSWSGKELFISGVDKFIGKWPLTAQHTILHLAATKHGVQ